MGDRKVWEIPDDPEAKDYRIRELHHFKSVPEVDAFLHMLGYSLADLLAIPRSEG